ncbi:MAG: hypothetical protein Q9213_008363, partial [Squamulea squamosa]
MDPSDSDNALLERLNALKKPSVSLDSTFHPIQQPPQDVSNITARFHNLKSARKNDPDALIASIAEAPPNEDDAPPSPTVEELLADLGPEEQWVIEKDETAHIASLLEEAKNALPDNNGEYSKNESTAKHVKDGRLERGEDEGSRRASSTNDEDEGEEGEEEEATLQLQRILDELDLNDTDPIPPSPPPQQPQHSLPSAPQTAPTHHPTNPTNSHDDHNIFPSVPFSLPSSTRKPTSKEEEDPAT